MPYADDVIVEGVQILVQQDEKVFVVTSDRELQDRCSALGALPISVPMFRNFLDACAQNPETAHILWEKLQGDVFIMQDNRTVCLTGVDPNTYVLEDNIRYDDGVGYILFKVFADPGNPESAFIYVRDYRTKSLEAMHAVVSDEYLAISSSIRKLEDVLATMDDERVRETLKDQRTNLASLPVPSMPDLSGLAEFQYVRRDTARGGNVPFSYVILRDTSSDHGHPLWFARIQPPEPNHFPEIFSRVGASWVSPDWIGNYYKSMETWMYVVISTDPIIQRNVFIDGLFGTLEITTGGSTFLPYPDQPSIEEDTEGRPIAVFKKIGNGDADNEGLHYCKIFNVPCASADDIGNCVALSPEDRNLVNCPESTSTNGNGKKNGRNGHKKPDPTEAEPKAPAEVAPAPTTPDGQSATT